MRPFTQFLKPRRKRNLRQKRLRRVRNVNLLQKSLSIILNPIHLLQLALLSRRSHTSRISSKKKRFLKRLKRSQSHNANFSISSKKKRFLKRLKRSQSHTALLSHTQGCLMSNTASKCILWPANNGANS